MQAKPISLLTNKKQAPVQAAAFLILTFCLTLVNVVSFGQESNFKIYPTVGISWRSTVTHFLNLNGVYPLWSNQQLYDYERNVQGFSLNTGVLLVYKNLIEFEYYPNWRYDVIHWKRYSDNEFVKEFSRP